VPDHRKYISRQSVGNVCACASCTDQFTKQSKVFCGCQKHRLGTSWLCCRLREAAYTGWLHSAVINAVLCLRELPHCVGATVSMSSTCTQSHSQAPAVTCSGEITEYLVHNLLSDVGIERMVEKV